MKHSSQRAAGYETQRATEYETQRVAEYITQRTVGYEAQRVCRIRNTKGLNSEMKDPEKVHRYEVWFQVCL